MWIECSIVLINQQLTLQIIIKLWYSAHFIIKPPTRQLLRTCTCIMLFFSTLSSLFTSTSPYIINTSLLQHWCTKLLTKCMCGHSSFDHVFRVAPNMIPVGILANGFSFDGYHGTVVPAALYSPTGMVGNAG